MARQALQERLGKMENYSCNIIMLVRQDSWKLNLVHFFLFFFLTPPGAQGNRVGVLRTRRQIKKRNTNFSQIE